MGSDQLAPEAMCQLAGMRSMSRPRSSIRGPSQIGLARSRTGLQSQIVPSKGSARRVTVMQSRYAGRANACAIAASTPTESFAQLAVPESRSKIGDSGLALGTGVPQPAVAKSAVRQASLRRNTSWILAPKLFAIPA